jgi:gliding motility-associated-like protein
MKRLIIFASAIFCISLLAVLNYSKCNAQCTHDTVYNCPPNSVTLTLTPPCGGDVTTSYTINPIAFNLDPHAGTNAFQNTWDDEYSETVLPIGFKFCYFGTTYTQFVAGSNENICFDLTQVNNYDPWPINNGIPDNSGNTPMNSILGPWEDIDPTLDPQGVDDIKYQVLGCYPYRRLVVSYNNIPYFDTYDCPNMFATSQIKIFESTNAIEVHIGQKVVCTNWNNGGAIEGMQDPTGTIAPFVAGRNYPPTWTANNDAYQFCPNSPAPTINWYNGVNLVGTGTSISVSPMQTTTYTAQIIYTCSGDTANFLYTVMVGDSLPTMSSTADSCSNGVGTASAIAHGTGPFTYTWSPAGGNAANATNLVGGLYTITITDGAGCQTIDTITVANITGVTAGDTVFQNVTCFGMNNGIAAVTGVVGNYTYTWSPSGGNAATASNLSAGTYTCSIINPNNVNCVTSEILTIIQPPALTVTSSPKATTCAGGNTGADTAFANGGVGPYTYIWTPIGGNTATAANIPAGNYTVTVTDANGCTATSTSIVQSTNTLNVTISPNITICIGQSTILTATASNGTGPYTYAWSNGGNGNPITVNPIITTSYSVTVTDANGCQGISGLVTVTVDPPLSVTAQTAVSICSGETATISATATGGDGIYTYTWNNGLGNSGGPFTVSPLVTTTYTVILTDACGSPSATDSVTITVTPGPAVQFTGSPAAGCIPLTVQFTDQTIPQNIITGRDWNFGDGTAHSDSTNPLHIYTVAGSYSVTLTITTSTGCVVSHTDSNMINAYPLPEAHFVIKPDSISILNPQVNFYNISQGDSTAYWSFGDSTTSSQLGYPYLIHTYPDTGTYWVSLIIFNQWGCSDTATGTVHITPYTTFYIPNCFAPGHGGNNRYFTGYGIGIQSFQMSIFNRWGEELFSSRDLNNPWDGTYNGNDVPEGVYVYNIIVKDNNGVTHNYNGNVTLIR